MHGPAIVEYLRAGTRTLSELAHLTGLTLRQVGYALRGLPDAGPVATDGRRVQASTTPGTASPLARRRTRSMTCGAPRGSATRRRALAAVALRYGPRRPDQHRPTSTIGLSPAHRLREPEQGALERQSVGGSVVEFWESLGEVGGAREVGVGFVRPPEATQQFLAHLEAAKEWLFVAVAGIQVDEPLKSIDG